jgi:hypothetical protein
MVRTVRAKGKENPTKNRHGRCLTNAPRGRKTQRKTGTGGALPTPRREGKPDKKPTRTRSQTVLPERDRPTTDVDSPRAGRVQHTLRVASDRVARGGVLRT